MNYKKEIILNKKANKELKDWLEKHHIYTFYSEVFEDGFSLRVLCIKMLNGVLQCQASLFNANEEKLVSSSIFEDYYGRWSLCYKDNYYTLDISKEEKEEKDKNMNTNIEKTCIQLYVLTEVVAREIKEPQIFFSRDDAVKELEKRINEAFSYTIDGCLSVHNSGEWEQLSDDFGCKSYQDGTWVVFGLTENDDNIDWTITPHKINIKLSLTNL